jgi:toxin HigB-1
MIRSFADGETEKIFNRDFSRKLPPEIQSAARRKMMIIHAAGNLHDLRVPPGNRLEVLHGDREGQYSIRINEQWRLCFRWKDGNASEVEITDYH